jgi:hypothetical protein
MSGSLFGRRLRSESNVSRASAPPQVTHTDVGEEHDEEAQSPTLPAGDRPYATRYLRNYRSDSPSNNSVPGGAKQPARSFFHGSYGSIAGK